MNISLFLHDCTSEARLWGYLPALIVCSDHLFAVRRVEVKYFLLLLREEGKVDGQVGGVHLLLIMLRFFIFGWLLLIRTDQHDVVAADITAITDKTGLVLQVLLVLEVVEKAIGRNTLDKLVQIEVFLRDLILLLLTQLQPRELLFRKCLDAVL